ncbi:hypothetical protein BATDEDRAFT_26889 [Batrachochytrium dendrobatidis JAM81]|uniref:Uncharacterized protein n=1 Tax=Batrachochytrium dendrobatidis (strain JAM81 / FGSC 10211) TaxID=684364 RepID=F4P9A5_BATDJ|nr:uncharacterized protein BATDEDRAFT_26889 [Batrachochytrium dendrobatidis JAM81]EGF78147.1 hypothetical protein BATDEDRAFT_26889 [Batrachochytrium dendrobatidis JAM81]|eukprot:XP_006681080.1 hypothetical protein BATDEDRAFT_26889 [Batrachochytrium dendrobatidis JAM81]
MSSNKHQPNLGKRPHSEVTPEFPSLPSLSFAAVQEFAGKSQEALVSVQESLVGATFPGSSLFLPLISPHQLQQRFNVADDDSVLVVIRKSYPLLKSEIISLNNKKYSGIYVRGPVGVGKSYLLYLLASEYRLNRPYYRVTYINDCKSWRTDPYGYLLEELVTTFYTDFVDNNNLQWLVICDQHNALFSPSVIFDKFPFSIIDYIAINRGSNIKVVISASANNEGYPTEMKGWQTHDISSHRFDDDEFKVWCDHYELETIGKVNPESEQAVDALYWTGGVPYELDLLWKQPKMTLVEKTLEYREKRVEEMAESHGKFCDKLSEEKKLNLKECISRMALRMVPPEINVGMDRQFISWQGLMTSLGVVAELILKGKDYPNTIKGKISEMYITTMLELSQLFSFQFRKVSNIAKIGLQEDSPLRKSIEIKSVVHFLRNKLPPKTSFQKNVTTLFVPESPNYPRFDFFLWDSNRQLMMGFQVTVLNPFSEHPKMTNSQMWQIFASVMLTNPNGIVLDCT